MERHSSGFTLMELMVALAVGLLVTLAAVQMFVVNQQSFNLQRGMGDVQDNGRFALDFIGRDVRMADLKSVDTNLASLAADRRGVVMSDAEIPGTGNATLISLDGSTSLGVGSSDQLTLQHVSLADNDRDCEGNTVPHNDGTMVVDRYFMRADPASGSPSALACDGGYYDIESGAKTRMGDNGVVLLSGVDSFQVLYGVNGGVPKSCTPVRYLTAAQFQALGAATMSATTILGVKVGILVRSQDTTGTLPDSPAFDVLDVTLAGTLFPKDGKIRRLFTSSMALRNSLPSGC